MSIPSEHVDFFRAQWGDRYVDSCTVLRATGTTFDEDTGQTTPTNTTVYSGACLVRPASGGTADFGEARRQFVDYDLHLPYDSVELTEEDVVTVTSTTDPDIPTLVVLRGITDSYLTDRRYECRAIVEPPDEESSSSSSSASSSSSSS